MNARGMAALAAAVVGAASLEQPTRRQPGAPRLDRGFLYEPRKGTKAQRWRKYKHAMGRAIRARKKAGTWTPGVFGKHLRKSVRSAE